MRLLLCLMLMVGSFGACQADIFQSKDKIYIDPLSFDVGTQGNEFYLHAGGNEWLVTSTIHRDGTGMFSYESDIKRSDSPQSTYEKKWKCPYCHEYWAKGTPCGNPECPSRY